MKSSLYMSLEWRLTKEEPWSHFARLPDLGATPLLNALLGGEPPHPSINPSDAFETRNALDDIDLTSLAEDYYYIDDTFADSPVFDLLDEARICTRPEAREWVDSGAARYLDSGSSGTHYKVTDPLMHSHSWLNVEEVAVLVERFEKYRHPRADTSMAIRIDALRASMLETERRGGDARLVYWFLTL